MAPSRIGQAWDLNCNIRSYVLKYGLARSMAVMLGVVLVVIRCISGIMVKLWVGHDSEVFEVVSLAMCRVDDGRVLLGGVENDSVVMPPLVDGGL